MPKMILLYENEAAEFEVAVRTVPILGSRSSYWENRGGVSRSLAKLLALKEEPKIHFTASIDRTRQFSPTIRYRYISCALEARRSLLSGRLDFQGGCLSPLLLTHVAQG